MNTPNYVNQNGAAIVKNVVPLGKVEKVQTLYCLGVGSKNECPLLVEHLGVRVYGCEPDPRQYKKLCKDFPGSLNNWAITEVGGGRELDFLLAENPMQSSLYAIPDHKLVETVKVKGYSLDEFDRWAGYKKDIILWLDIQGAELDALNGGAKLLTSGRVRLVNVELIRNEKLGWGNQSQIITKLKYYGFKFVCKYLDQRTHFDAVFRYGGKP